MPEISVVMPVYNREDMVQEAIDSILNQTYSNFEFIIIDDCSTDRTCQVIERYNDSRIRFVKNLSKGNIPALRNQGIDLANGKYIAIMDSDDIALPYRLAIQKQFLDENDDYGLVGSFINQSDGKIRSYPQGNDLLRYFSAFKCSFCNPTIMLRKKILDQYHIRHDETCTVASDYSLQISMLPYTKIENLSTVCLLYRFHKNNITNMTTHNSKQAIMRAEIIDKIHERALKNLEIELNQDELAIFLAFTGESARKLPSKSIFDQFKQLLDKLLARYGNKFGKDNMNLVHNSMIARIERNYSRQK